MEAVKSSGLIEILLPMLAIVFIVAVGVVMLYMHFQKNLFAQTLEKERLKNTHQADLLRSNMLTQEEERKRIAHDLHDELGAALSIMRMHIMMMEQNNSDVPAISSGLQNLRTLSETALSSMRGISHRLCHPSWKRLAL